MLWWSTMGAQYRQGQLWLGQAQQDFHVSREVSSDFYEYVCNLNFDVHLKFSAAIGVTNWVGDIHQQARPTRHLHVRRTGPGRWPKLRTAYVSSFVAPILMTTEIAHQCHLQCYHVLIHRLIRKKEDGCGMGLSRQDTNVPMVTCLKMDPTRTHSPIALCPRFGNPLNCRVVKVSLIRRSVFRNAFTTDIFSAPMHGKHSWLLLGTGSWLATQKQGSENQSNVPLSVQDVYLGWQLSW